MRTNEGAHAMQARRRPDGVPPSRAIARSAPRAIARSFAQGFSLPPAGALALVLNALLVPDAAPESADRLCGRVIGIRVEGVECDVRVAYTRGGFTPRRCGARADLRLYAAPYDLYLLARGLAGLDELVNTRRVAVVGSAALRDALFRLLATAEWTALPAVTRRTLDGLARLHVRWRH
jgi:predicted lipid carrier protein YhbT